jgi:regulatory protein
MRPATRKLENETDSYAAALYALGRRAHSVWEMRTYLERRGASPELARRVVARLRREELLDDARYALGFARRRAATRHLGPHRIASELRRRGVPDRHIEAALEQAFAETDEALLVRKVIERRLRAARGPVDRRRMASLYRTLLRAGFDTSLIQRELRAARLDSDSIPEIADTALAEDGL